MSNINWKLEAKFQEERAVRAEYKLKQAEAKLAAVKDDVGTIMMLVRPEPHEHEYIAARCRLQAWLWPHTKEVQP